MERMLRQERLKRKWTLAYVGKAVGVKQQHMHDIEVGRSNPSYAVLCKLEDLFHMSHRELLAAVPEPLSPGTNCTKKSDDLQDAM